MKNFVWLPAGYSYIFGRQQLFLGASWLLNILFRWRATFLGSQLGIEIIFGCQQLFFRRQSQEKQFFGCQNLCFLGARRIFWMPGQPNYLVLIIPATMYYFYSHLCLRYTWSQLVTHRSPCRALFLGLELGIQLLHRHLRKPTDFDTDTLCWGQVRCLDFGAVILNFGITE